MSEQWWFDSATGQVSQDKASGWENRMGPYSSKEEAQNALEIARKRNEQADDYDDED
ncbi:MULTISPECIES: hypothetical protein [Corynebacterium]|uniref:hypothetical protein n=1 Tax=Corynebacterium TaxID=1716 RepID=UPI0018658537|nr:MULTISPECIES: hypothetical protein [Corynebacterium]